MAKKRKAAARKEPEKKGIVTATGSASVSDTPGLSQKIEKAMSQAVLDCAADGISDPVKIKKAMLRAREEVKAFQ